MCCARPSRRYAEFAGLITPLVENGYSVIALDGPAHGHSPGREAHVLLFARAMLEAALDLLSLLASCHVQERQSA